MKSPRVDKSRQDDDEVCPVDDFVIQNDSPKFILAFEHFNKSSSPAKVGIVKSFKFKVKRVLPGGVLEPLDTMLPLLISIYSSLDL